MSDIVVHPVTPDRWDDLVALFERPGPRGGKPIPGHCWCMAHRDENDLPLADLRKEALRALVASGEEPGLLAYQEGDPVGWVAVAPREEYGALQRSRLYGPLEGDEGVFAITCFYVDPEVRGSGVSSALLDAAVDFAAARGARAVDAFPKVALAPHTAKNAKAEQNFSFMGRAQSFTRRGFKPVREGGARSVLRRGMLGDTNEGRGR